MLVNAMPRPRMSRRLTACVVVAIGLHALLLAWAQRQPSEAAQVQSRPGHAVTVRLLSPGTAVAQAPAAQAPTPQQAEQAAVAETSTQSAAGDADPAQANASSNEGSSTADLDGYVPRRWLTVAPQATAPILLPFPAAFKDRARYTVVLNLFIEADGRVGRVEFEGVALPDVLEHAARTTFEHARFTPGQVRGRIVKSLIRVEVDFDALGSG
jgi:outer membrane biosynthesis protein TonB